MEQLELIELGQQAAHVAHALKNVSGILANSSDLLRLQPESTRSVVPILDRVERKISALSEQILRPSLVPEISFRELDVLKLLLEVKELPEIASRIERAGILLKISGNAVLIEGQKEELAEAIVCLIENAIDSITEKAAPGGRITLKIRDHSLHGPGQIEIWVEDNGCGIPSDRINKIFNRFFTSKKESGGTGIGLAVVKKAVEVLHNGKIVVESQGGIGSRFGLIIPRHQPGEIASQKPMGIADKIRQLRQQVAELETDYREQIDGCLSQMSMQHIIESTPEELSAQIFGQIQRLEDYLKTGVPHISLNNFSRRTEVVLAGDADTTSRDYWENLVRYELQKMGLAEQISVSGTRTIELSRSACRIFEIDKMGSKLTEEEMRQLESTLQKKFVPLPSSEELRAQSLFLGAAVKLLERLKRPGSVHSLILNPSLDRELRLASYRISSSPFIEPPVENVIADRFVLERPSPGITLTQLIEAQRGEEYYLLNDVLDPLTLASRLGPFSTAIVNALGIRSALVAVFASSQGGKIVNLLCSVLAQKYPPETEREFLAMNKGWKEFQR